MFSDERHIMYYRHRALVTDCFAVQLQYGGVCELEDTKKAVPRECAVTGYFYDALGNPVIYFKSGKKNFKPSVRAELEKAVKDYLLICGLDIQMVVREAHSVVVSYRNGEVQYGVNYTGVPGSGKVDCNISFFQQMLFSGTKDIDIKRRNALMSFADGVCRGHFTDWCRSRQQ